MSICNILSLLLLLFIVVVISEDCISWYNECDGVHECNSIADYNGSSSDCLIKVPESLVPLPGDCVIINNTCQFVNPCVSWNKGCYYLDYQCTSNDEYAEYVNSTTTDCLMTPPPADRRCLLINDSCQWYNDCIIWSKPCNNGYNCGDEIEYYKIINGPQLAQCYNNNNTDPPVGECIYQVNQCVWSNCTSFLTPCMTSWRCDTHYQYLAAQLAPPSPCPHPPEGFTPPVEPGICTYSVTEQLCVYTQPLDYTCVMNTCAENNTRCVVNTQQDDSICLPSCFVNNGGCDNDTICSVSYNANCHQAYCSSLNCGNTRDGDCPLGMEYNDCGSHCHTCDMLDSVCPAVCVSGCFCPTGLIQYRDRCVDILECPSLLANPPPIDPLPLDDDTVLINLLVANETLLSFKNHSSKLINDIRVLLLSKGVESPTVTMYGSMDNANFTITVAVMITSNDISDQSVTGADIIVIFDNVLNNTQLNIIAASQVYSKYSYNTDNSDNTVLLLLVIILPDVAFLLLIAAIIAIIVIIIVYVVRRRRNKRQTASVYVTLQDKST